ncbi:hypothetical protein LQW54_012301 [Pestalotiopsis sp. IQ-011]
MESLYRITIPERIEIIFTHEVIPVVAISVAAYAFTQWREHKNAQKAKNPKLGSSGWVQREVRRGQKDAGDKTQSAAGPDYQTAMERFGEAGKDWERDTESTSTPTGPTTKPRAGSDDERRDEDGSDGWDEEVSLRAGARSRAAVHFQDDEDSQDEDSDTAEEEEEEEDWREEWRQEEEEKETEEEARDLVIDAEYGLFQSARPRVSAYVEEGREHLRKAGSWFGLPEPQSPLNVLKKASQLEWALLMGLKDVTKAGIKGFDDPTQRVKPSRQADLGRRAAFAHLDSLDWHEVLVENAYRLEDHEYLSLEDSIDAFLGDQIPTKPPRVTIEYERVSPTPREYFAEGKRRRSSLMNSLTVEDIESDEETETDKGGLESLIEEVPLTESVVDEVDESKEARRQEALKIVTRRHKSIMNNWILHDEVNKKRIKRMSLLRLVQEERAQEAEYELSKEKGETLAILAQADNVSDMLRKHCDFLAHAYAKALERASVSDDIIRYWEKSGSGQEMDHFPEKLRERFLQDNMSRSSLVQVN